MRTPIRLSVYAKRGGIRTPAISLRTTHIRTHSDGHWLCFFVDLILSRRHPRKPSARLAVMSVPLARGFPERARIVLAHSTYVPFSDACEGSRSVTTVLRLCTCGVSFFVNYCSCLCANRCVYETDVSVTLSHVQACNRCQWPKRDSTDGEK